VHLPELTSDVEHGAEIYSQQCSACHEKEGGGNGPMLPPLWGPGVYNEGAGINGVPKMAAFVQHNMPQNKPGSLSAQDAFDVAAFIRSNHTRPSIKDTRFIEQCAFELILPRMPERLFDGE